MDNQPTLPPICLTLCYETGSLLGVSSKSAQQPTNHHRLTFSKSIAVWSWTTSQLYHISVWPYERDCLYIWRVSSKAAQQPTNHHEPKLSKNICVLYWQANQLYHQSDPMLWDCLSISGGCLQNQPNSPPTTMNQNSQRAYVFYIGKPTNYTTSLTLCYETVSLYLEGVFKTSPTAHQPPWTKIVKKHMCFILASQPTIPPVWPNAMRLSLYIWRLSNRKHFLTTLVHGGWWAVGLVLKIPSRYRETFS